MRLFEILRMHQNFFCRNENNIPFIPVRFNTALIANLDRTVSDHDVWLWQAKNMKDVIKHNEMLLGENKWWEAFWG
jgi:hypothetical protein